VQRRAFAAQAVLASELGLPLVVHSRDAFAETLAILDNAGLRESPVLWHCFGQGPDQAREILSRGWHLSIPGTVTHARSDALRLAVAGVPLSSMVLETDSPFLAPEPWRGKTNEPAFLAFTSAAVAAAKGLPPETVWLETARTAKAFFGLERLPG
jgi:TatD DNase family protein